MHINLNIDTENERKNTLLALATFANALSEVAVAPPISYRAGIVGGNVPIVVNPGTLSGSSLEGCGPIKGQHPQRGAQQAPSRGGRKAKAEPEPTTAEAAGQANDQATTEAAAQANAQTNPDDLPAQTGADPVVAANDYTEGDVQGLAVSVSRLKGPEMVKAKIAELGATRIAELTPAKVNELGAWLELQK